MKFTIKITTPTPDTELVGRGHCFICAHVVDQKSGDDFSLRSRVWREGGEYFTSYERVMARMEFFASLGELLWARCYPGEPPQYKHEDGRAVCVRAAEEQP